MKVALCGIVCALALAASLAQADDADPKLRAVALADLGRLKAAMTSLQFDCGSLPSNMQGLAALLADPGFKGWNGPYLNGALPVDPWKSPYRYTLTKDSYEILSAGPDTKFETPDDLAAK